MMHIKDKRLRASTVSKEFIAKRYEWFVKVPIHDKSHWPDWDDSIYKDYLVNKRITNTACGALLKATADAKMFFIDESLLPEWYFEGIDRDGNKLKYTDYTFRDGEELKMPFNNAIFVVLKNGHFDYFLHYLAYETSEGFEQIFACFSPRGKNDYFVSLFIYRENSKVWDLCFWSDEENKHDTAREIIKINTVADFFQNLQSCKKNEYAKPVTKKNKEIRDGISGDKHKYYRVVLQPTMGVDTGETRDYQPRRNHEVRGHWRTYANGQRTWVRSHRRGDETLGKVSKTYLLEAAQ